jgi:hypothetical protein
MRYPCFKTTAFCDNAPCSLVEVDRRPDDGGSKSCPATRHVGAKGGGEV